MKKILYIFGMLIGFGACSDAETENYGTQGDVIAITPLKVGALTSRSILQNTSDQTLNSGNVHVMAQVQGETQWYIDDDLCKIEDWDWTTNNLCPSFLTLNGSGRKKSDYEYNTISPLKVYYWPSNKKIIFYGYYVQKDADVNYITQTGSTITYTLDDVPANQCDLLVAEPDTTDAIVSATTGIQQKFCHTMAMIRFDFISRIKADGEVYLRKYTYETASKGSMDVKNPISMAPDMSSPKITVTCLPDLPVRNVDDYYTATYSFSETTAALVFPTITKFTIKVFASRANGTGEMSREIDLTVPTEGFKAGYLYQYVITYSADVIDVAEPKVVPWDDSPDNVVEDLSKY